MSGERMPRSTSNDLKLQLGELQRKFAPQNVRGARAGPGAGSGASAASNAPPIHLPPMMPPAGRAARVQRDQPPQNTTSKTVDFLGDLSDGLLIESRRLAHENGLYKSKVAQRETENATLKKQLANLTAVFEKANAREEELNDEKWDLELQLKNLTKAHAKALEDIKTYKQSQSTTVESADLLRGSLDALKEDRAKLEEALHTQIDALKAEVVELKESNENLNDENDILHQNFIALKADFEKVDAQRSQLEAELNASDSDNSDVDYTFDDSLLVDPQPLVPAAQDSESADNETLRRNLNHAYALIKKLRTRPRKSPRKSPHKTGGLWAASDNEDSFEKNAVPDLSSDEDLLEASSPIKSMANNGDFVIIVPSNLSANEVLSNIDSYKSIPVNKSEFKVLSSISSQGPVSPIKFNPKAITSSKYSDNNMVKLVTLDELNDLKEVLKDKELEIKHLKSQLGTTAGMASATTTVGTLGVAGAAGMSLAGAAFTAAAATAGLSLSSNDKDNKLSISSESHQKLLDQNKSLQAKLDDPDFAYLQKMVAKRGLITLPDVELTSLKQELVQRDAQLATLSSELHAAKTQVSNTESTLASKSNSLLTLEATLATLNAKIETLTAEATQSQSQLKARNASIEALETQIDEKETLIKSLQTQVDEKESQLRSLKIEVGEIGTRLVTLESQAEHKDAHIATLESQIKSPAADYIKSRAEIHGMLALPQTEHDSLIAKLADKDSEIQSFKARIETPDAVYIKSKAEAHGLIAVPLADHESLKTQLADSNSKIKSLASEVSEYKSQLDLLHTQIDSPDIDYIKSKSLAQGMEVISRAENEAQKSKISELESKLSELDSKLSTLESEVSDKDCQLRTLQSQIAEKETELNSIQRLVSEKDTTLQTHIGNHEQQLKTLQSQIDSPDADYIKIKSREQGLVAVPMAEHESLKTQLTDADAEVKSLRSQLDAPSLDYIKSKSSLHGIVPLPSTVHDSLKKEVADLDGQLKALRTEIQSPDVEYIKSKSAIHGLVALPSDEHESMKLELGQLSLQLDELNKHKNSVDEELSQKRETIVAMELEIANLKFVQQELQSLRKEKLEVDQSLTTLQAENSELKKVSKLLESKKVEFDELQSKFEQPSVEYIQSKAAMHNIIPVPVDQHESTQSEIAETKAQIKSLSSQIIALESKHDEKDKNIDSMRSELEAKIDHLNNIQSQLDSPSVEYIKSKSANHGLVAVPMLEHDSLKAQLASSQAEIASLKSDIENPSIDYITSKSTTRGLTVLPIEDHNSLNSELSNLKASYSNPDADYIKSKASIHDLVVVPVEEHTKIQSDIIHLKQSIEKPDASYIESKAKSHGLVAIPMDEHTTLQTELQITSDKLANISEDLASKHAQLETLVEEKTQIEHKLDSLKKVESQYTDVQTQLAAKEEELLDLRSKFEHPSEDYIKTKSSIHGLIPIPVDHHISLTTQIEENNSELQKLTTEIVALRKVKEDLELQGIKSVSIELHDSVQAELSESKERTNEIAKKLDTVNQELTLRDEKIDILQRTASELTLKAEKLTDLEKELSSLKDTKSQLDSKHKEFHELQTAHDDLLLRFNNLKHIENQLVGVQSELESKSCELQKLQCSFDKPTEDYIKLKSKELGLIAISDKDHETMKNDLEIKLREIEQLDSVKSELESHQLELNSLREKNDNLQSKIEELQLLELKLGDANSDLASRELDLATVNEQLENPDIEYIKSKSERHGLIAIPMTEHTNSINEVHFLKDTIETKEQELVALKKSEASLLNEKTELSARITQFEKECLEAKVATEQTMKELAQLKSNVESPTLEYIKTKSEANGLIAVPAEEFRSIKSQLTNAIELTSQKDQELESKNIDLETTKAENYHLLVQMEEVKAKSAKELASITGLYENPSSDYLKLKAAKVGLTLLAVTELQELMTKSANLASDLNKKSQLVESLQSKVATLETPSKEYIHTRSTAMGFIPIPIFEHKNLTTEVASAKKLVGELETTNKKLEAELENVKEAHQLRLDETSNKINILKQQIDEPSASYIKSKSLAHGLVSIPAVDHQLLTKEIDSQKIALTAVKAELESNKAELSMKHEELKDHKSQLASKEEELNLHKSELSSAQREIECHKTQLEQIEKEQVDLSTANVTKVDNLENEIAELRGLLDDKNKEIERLSLQQDVSSGRVQTLESEIASLHARLKDELALNSENNELLKTELSEKSNLIEKMNKELNEPSADYVKSKAALHCLVPLTIDEHDQLKSELQKHKDDLVDLIQVKDQLDEKHRKLETCIAELDDVKTQLGDKNKEVESLEMTTSDSMKKVGELEQELSSLNAKLVGDLQESNKVIESMKKELETKNCLIERLQQESEKPSAEYIKSKSALHGFVPVPVEEQELQTSQIAHHESQLNALQSQVEQTKAELELAKQKADVESDELQRMHATELSQRNELVCELESQLMNFKKRIETVQNQLDEAIQEDIDELKLEQKAIDRGFVLLPTPQPKEISSNMMEKSSSVTTITQNGNKIPESSLNLIIDALDKNGLKCVPVEEYNEMATRPRITSASDITIDEDDLANATFEADQIKSELQDKKEQLNKLELKSRRSSFMSVSSGASSISVSDLLHNKEMTIQKKKSSIIEKIEILEKKKKETQKQMNRVSVASFDSEVATNSALNSRLEKKLATINDKIELANIELHSQQSALDAVQEYIKSAKSMNLAPISTQGYAANSDSSSVHTLDQMAVIKNDIADLESKYNSKVAELEDLRQHLNKFSDPQEMIIKLTSLGYSVDKKSFEGGTALKPVESTASFATTNGSEYFDAESYITNAGASSEPELKAIAAKLGLALVPITQVSQHQVEVAKADGDEFSDLQWKSHELGYELIKIEELNKLKERAEELPESLNIVDLQMYANKLDLKVLSDEDIQQLKKRPVTSKELAIKAAELKLVMLSEQEANELETKKPITAENLTERAKLLGYLCIAKSQYIATTVAKECDTTTAVVLSNTYYKKLLKSHDFFKKSNKTVVDNVVPEVIPEDTEFLPEAPAMSISNVDATSLHTVNTVISNKQEIIAAVAQTIIGEYLYKYYRKLGPLSSIADSRHERYFWIHPYSLTIYWSTSNPVLTDPGKTQIKAMSIVSVQSVDDNNPLPPGIYHRSIIIKSHDRSIKLTCPTRQRHNIWFNSLKYLIEKSTENWVNDDNVEDQYTQTFHMDKRIELDRTQSMAFRHSQPRNVSFKSLENRRISSVPSMRNSLRN